METEKQSYNEFKKEYMTSCDVFKKTRQRIKVEAAELDMKMPEFIDFIVNYYIALKKNNNE